MKFVLCLALLICATYADEPTQVAPETSPDAPEESKPETPSDPLHLVDDDDDDDAPESLTDMFMPFPSHPLPNGELSPMANLFGERPPPPFFHHPIMMPHTLPRPHMFGSPMELEVELPRHPHPMGLAGLLDSFAERPRPPHPFLPHGMMQLGPVQVMEMDLPSKPVHLQQPPSFLHNILNGVLGPDLSVLGLPDEIHKMIEERHSTIPSDHEPMMLKMEKKDQFYVVTGFFPGVSKGDLNIKVDGSKLLVKGKVTDKSEEAKKDLEEFGDVDEVEETMELPYSPDGRFVKAHFDDTKHTLTIVFPQEKSSDIQIS